MDVNVFIPALSLRNIVFKNSSIDLFSGLTCTPNNASEKSFLQYFGTKYGFAIVFPDTSPSGANIEGEDESCDFGTGAGFYLDATEEPWLKNYNMYSYVHKELLTELAKRIFSIWILKKISSITATLWEDMVL